MCTLLHLCLKFFIINIHKSRKLPLYKDWRMRLRHRSMQRVDTFQNWFGFILVSVSPSSGLNCWKGRLQDWLLAFLNFMWSGVYAIKIHQVGNSPRLEQVFRYWLDQKGLMNVPLRHIVRRHQTHVSTDFPCCPWNEGDSNPILCQIFFFNNLETWVSNVNDSPFSLWMINSSQSQEVCLLLDNENYSALRHFQQLEGMSLFCCHLLQALL